MEIVRKADNRGGYRPGAGRKPEITATLSQAQLQLLLKKQRKWGRRYKKDVADVLLGIIYDENVKDADKIAG